jgi:hypothetical protein
LFILLLMKLPRKRFQTHCFTDCYLKGDFRLSFSVPP